MANLSRRNQGWGIDPWRDLFDVDFFRNRSRQEGSMFPAVNISENEQGFMVDVVAPGFKKEDFKVNVENDVLTINAEAKQESSEEGNNKEFSRREYSYSSFTRSFQLPDNAKDDSISARYEDGILKITIPKSAGQVKASKAINVE